MEFCRKIIMKRTLYCLNSIIQNNYFDTSVFCVSIVYFLLLSSIPSYGFTTICSQFDNGEYCHSRRIWWSRRMCALLLLQELQNYNSLLKNHWQEIVGSHQKEIPHVQGLRALNAAVHAWGLLKEVSIIFITSTIVWPQVNQQGQPSEQDPVSPSVSLYWWRNDTERWTLQVSRCPICYWTRVEK